MTDTARQQPDALPSGRTLVKLTGLAVAIAAVILFTMILPAEYGIDPTGIGRHLGLTSLSAGPAAKPAATEPAAAKPSDGAERPISLSEAPELELAGVGRVWKAARPYRSDELSLTLRPNEGAEIKASMEQGERFVFSWVAEGGAVNFDMHGERLGAKSDDFTSYWKGRNASSGHGEFQAPFPGTHGWYWRNRGAQPVTIKVKTSGFYEKLHKPGAGAPASPAHGGSK
jgi:hypothetical protein